jgi:hypothetical protein
MTELSSSAANHAAAREWAGILDPGEEIVWQGQPAPRLRMEFRTPFEPLFFTFFTGFSIFWMAMASQGGGFFWTFGLLFFFVGTYNLVGQHFWKRYLRSRTFYTLTSRRALIATNVWSKRTLNSFPITKDTNVQLSDGEPGSVYFATETTSNRNGGVTQTRIGFDLIEDCRSVYAMIREVQNGK